VAGKLQGITPEQALIGMWMKHIVSIMDITNDLNNGTLPTDDAINEKFGDVINYGLLLESLIRERMA
jgi:hypothetical protein